MATPGEDNIEQGEFTVEGGMDNQGNTEDGMNTMETEIQVETHKVKQYLLFSSNFIK